MRILAPSASDITRFHGKTAPSGECIVWQAWCQPKGYGMFALKVDGSWTMALAHRVSYTIEHGDILEGMQVDHVCRNKSCVKPEHLRLTSNKQNHENHGGARADSKSGIRGVTWDKSRNKWQAIVRHHSRNHHAGRFDRIEDAEAAVIAKRNELFTHNNGDRVAA